MITKPDETPFADDAAAMRRAIKIAERGFGFVEPNPLVGSVLVDGQRNLIAEGIHERFGEPHAEVNALSAAGSYAVGATMFVTLEPCCHRGKTGPCTEAIIAAGIGRVVVGSLDPFPQVAGGGIAALRAAGIDVETGRLVSETDRLIAPFRKRVIEQMPWIHAKWAMTLDGKIASRTGHSKWISSEASREVVHALRGKMDAIVVGSNTAILDDPLLTARPAGPRSATRVVVDPRARLPIDSQLVKTAAETPVILATSQNADSDSTRRLANRGVEILHIPRISPEATARLDLNELFRELSRRDMTHVLVEGGGSLLGSLFDGLLADEVHVFLAPKIVGGAAAVTPVGGTGEASIPEFSSLDNPEIVSLGGDVYVHGRMKKTLGHE